MTASNLAIVLAPNLLYKKEDAFSFSDMEKCTAIVETMIIHYNYLFENIPLALSTFTDPRSSIGVVESPNLSPRNSANSNVGGGGGWNKGVKPTKRIAVNDKSSPGNTSNENISNDSKEEIDPLSDTNVET
jgi:hypothetical protein